MAINPYNNGTVPQAPFGDIYAVRTPKTDAAVARLQQQQWQSQFYDQQQRMAQANAMDKEFDRQLTGIRDADVEDVAGAYNDYASAKKDALFNPAYKKDPVARAKKEIEVNKLRAAYYATVQGSKQTADLHKRVNQGMLKNPDDYHDEAGNQLSEANGISTRGLNEMGWNNGEAWTFNDGKVDLTKNFAEAGKGNRKVLVPVGDVNGGLQRRTETWEAPTEPLKYKASLLNSVSSNGQAKTFRNRFKNNVTPEQEATIHAAYQAALNDKDLWGKMGIAPQPITFDPENPADRAAAYYAMEYFLANPPIKAKEQTTTNLNKVKALDFENWMKKNKITYGQRRALMAYGQQLRDAGVDDTWTFKAADAIKSGDLEEINKVLPRAGLAYKSGANVTGVEVPAETAFPAISAAFASAGLGSGQKGDIIINWTKKEKNPQTYEIEDVEQPPLRLDPKDPELTTKLAKFQIQTMGMKAKTFNEVGLGRGANNVAPKTLRQAQGDKKPAKAPEKKTESKPPAKKKKLY